MTGDQNPPNLNTDTMSYTKNENKPEDAELSRMQLRKDADLADMGRPLKFQYKENAEVRHGEPDVPK